MKNKNTIFYIIIIILIIIILYFFLSKHQCTKQSYEQSYEQYIPNIVPVQSTSLPIQQIAENIYNQLNNLYNKIISYYPWDINIKQNFINTVNSLNREISLINKQLPVLIKQLTPVQYSSLSVILEKINKKIMDIDAISSLKMLNLNINKVQIPLLPRPGLGLHPIEPTPSNTRVIQQIAKNIYKQANNLYNEISSYFPEEINKKEIIVYLTNLLNQEISPTNKQLPYLTKQITPAQFSILSTIFENINKTLTKIDRVSMSKFLDLNINKIQIPPYPSPVTPIHPSPVSPSQQINCEKYQTSQGDYCLGQEFHNKTNVRLCYHVGTDQSGQNRWIANVGDMICDLSEPDCRETHYLCGNKPSCNFVGTFCNLEEIRKL